MLRRTFTFFFVFLGLSLSGVGSIQAAPTVKVQQTEDLYADARQAEDQNLPLLIMFSQDGCSYCSMVREDFLEPMLKSGDYADKVIIRIVKVDDFSEVRDFDGKLRSASTIATRYRASVTPTVIFVDARGYELAERILGISTPALYGGILDDAIDNSLHRLRPINLSQQRGSSNG
ncbi:MAG: thioredoxin family protein [Thiohalophilus sp.]